MPDRTQALSAVGEGSDAPLEAMACNTAHAWHAALQARFPRTELLHVACEVAARLQALGVHEAGLMATQGTYRNGLYETALAQVGITCHLPHEAERESLMRGIYDGVRTGDMARHSDIALIMGCPEIPLALESAPQGASWTLVNPAQVLAQALASQAYAA